MSKIKKTDLIIRHIKGSGKGGQNRNKRFSGVQIIHLPSGEAVRSTERRSQVQNLEKGLIRLGAKVEAKYKKPTPRVKTRPKGKSKERRLEDKRKTGMKKSMRRVIAE